MICIVIFDALHLIALLSDFGQPSSVISFALQDDLHHQTMRSQPQSWVYLEYSLLEQYQDGEISLEAAKAGAGLDAWSFSMHPLSCWIKRDQIELSVK